MDESQEINSDDIIRIMVATDSHLGYNENNEVRGKDSFIAFEEMLQMAVSENVDFILLGGDLFHEATPSQNALNRCLKLLRKYCLGDKCIEIEFLSDQANNFPTLLNSTVNYQDPNINVSLPVFSIHGNHDDPSGFGRISSLDLLSNTGLINYFGRWDDLTRVEISPILLRKGETQLAIFGLSHIHDPRLARLFENDNVVIEHPDPTTGEWFNLMVLHQNRADRGPKNYIAEERLPDFMHLVIWGHEHDCHTSAEYNPRRDFYVYQPGSSVATSLSEGESLLKHVGILEIFKTKFQIKPLRLQSVRPFVFESVRLPDLVEELLLDEGNESNKVMEMAKERVEAMIERAKEQLTDHPEQPKLPLIRLRLEYMEEAHMFNAIRFGQQFNDRIANPADVIHFKKLMKRGKRENKEFDKDTMKNQFNKLDVDEERPEELVDLYFEEVDEKNSLKLFSSKILSEAVRRMVDSNDVDAADKIIKFYKQKALDHLMEKLPNEEEVENELLNFKKSNVVTLEMVRKMLDARGEKISKSKSSEAAADLDDDDDLLDADSHEIDQPEKPSGSRGRGKKEATTRGRGRGRGRGQGSTAANKKKEATTSTRAGHAMPKLDVSVNSTRSSGANPSLLDFIGKRQASDRHAGKPRKVYEISDSD